MIKSNVATLPTINGLSSVTIFKILFGFLEKVFGLFGSAFGPIKIYKLFLKNWEFFLKTKKLIWKQKEQFLNNKNLIIS